MVGGGQVGGGGGERGRIIRRRIRERFPIGKCFPLLQQSVRAENLLRRQIPRCGQLHRSDRLSVRIHGEGYVELH